MDEAGAQGGEGTLRILHDEQGVRGAFHVEEGGRRVAEMTYGRSHARPGTVIVDHTFVDPSLRGRGVARQLVLAAVDWARRDGLKIEPVCPFARAVFDRDASLADVRA